MQGICIKNWSASVLVREKFLCIEADSVQEETLNFCSVECKLTSFCSVTILSGYKTCVSIRRLRLHPPEYCSAVIGDSWPFYQQQEFRIPGEDCRVLLNILLLWACLQNLSTVCANYSNTPNMFGGRTKFFIGANFRDVRGRRLAQLEFVRFTDHIFKGVFTW